MTTNHDALNLRSGEPGILEAPYGGGQFEQARILVDQIQPADFVPANLPEIRPIVRDGVEFLLSHMSSRRFAALFSEQSALPTDTPRGVRMTLLAAHVPILHKLGQVISRKRTVPLPLRKALDALAESKGEFPFTAVQFGSSVVRPEKFAVALISLVHELDGFLFTRHATQ